MRLQSGSRLGPYEISAPIGAGGMGEVYRARDTRLGREVAIKVLPHDLSRDTQRLARFEREARSSSALNHPNIITIHDFTSADGETWLVMELMRGETLRQVISRGPMPIRKVLAIGAGIAEGLAAAHAAGLVHRDLKPENVMLAADGTPKILDFGLAKSLAIADATNTPTDVQVSRAGLVIGTATYMSPEQARGENLDFRTDQFSLGLILYEMVTAKNPFHRSSPVETLAAIINDEAPPLGEPLGWLVERCLQKDREERYGSTRDLAHDLRRMSVGRTLLSVRTDKSVGATWPLIVAAIALIALAAVLLTARRRPPAAPIEAAIAIPEIEQVSFGEVSSPVGISPDGRFLAVKGAGKDGVDRLWLHDLRSRATRQIAGSENALGATFSPDGKSLAYSASSQLKTISVDGGPPRILCDAPPPAIPTWQGDTIVFGSFAGIFRVNATGGVPQPLVRVKGTDVALWPEFLPDGKHFIYIQVGHQSEEIQHELMVCSIAGGEPRRIMSMDSRAVYSNGYLLFVREGTLLAQPFDLKTLRLSGEAQRLTDDIHYFRSPGLASFAISNDDVLVWRSARRPSREVWLDRNGVESSAIGTGTFSSARLSHDGTRFVAEVTDPKIGTGDLWIYDLARQNAERVTFRSTDEGNPVWSTDERSIYYRCDTFGPPDLWRWNLGDDHGARIYAGPGVEQPEDISNDGRHLLFVGYNRAAASDIWVMPLNPPGVAKPLFSTPFNEWSPRFSPDGRWVAYHSDVSGRAEVYVRALEGGITSRISRDGGNRPRWRGDGSELFFLGPDGRVMSAPMRDGASSGPPRMLFQSPSAVDFDPAADGSRFLMQLEERTQEPPVHLLINWSTRLKAP